MNDVMKWSTEEQIVVKFTFQGLPASEVFRKYFWHQKYKKTSNQDEKYDVK